MFRKTSAFIHLTAIDGRAVVEIDLKKFNNLEGKIIILEALKHLDTDYLEDLYIAVELDGFMHALASQLKLQMLDVTW